ncbi:MAG: FAD-dependent oxidoreductase [Clostridia bacterium]|nr:FAD-dependent oxidoreductase [Clostridia bacterium]
MVEVTVLVPFPYDEATVRRAVCEALPIRDDELLSVTVRKETLLTEDKPRLSYRLHVGVTAARDKEEGLLKMRKKVRLVPSVSLLLPKKSPAVRPVVIGAGPCGLFCALALAEAQARPILLERGSRVEERSRSVDTFFRNGVLDEETNVAFGEGGAGTFSDGKLKFGTRDAYVEKVLATFIAHGAPPDIPYRSHPHVGTDRLVGIVRGIRQRIEALGGEVRFDTRVTSIREQDRHVQAVHTVDRYGREEEIPAHAVFLATGHSARDVYHMLKTLGVRMEAKGFGVGVRIEHPAAWIDRLVFGGEQPRLGHAPYHLVTHLPNGRSVYSFCMCPGGQVICSSSEQGGIVTNGMSEYRRDADVSNAALLVSVTPEDFSSEDPLAGIAWQRSIERAAYQATGGFRAPAVRLSDFLLGRVSESFGAVRPSFPLGTAMVPFSSFLPDFVIHSLQNGLRSFDEWLPGYAYVDAVLTGPETRTTSPVRVVRDAATLESVTLHGLYPCGEGAGYGGGIVSSAVDGLRAAQTYLLSL